MNRNLKDACNKHSWVFQGPAGVVVEVAIHGRSCSMCNSLLKPRLGSSGLAKHPDARVPLQTLSGTQSRSTFPF